jgi:hypothetical protein
MSIFTLNTTLSGAFSVLSAGHWREREKQEASVYAGERPPFASKLEFDEYMLRDIGLGDGGYREWEDDRLA